jgi:hypothetical protein
MSENYDLPPLNPEAASDDEGSRKLRDFTLESLASLEARQKDMDLPAEEREKIQHEIAALRRQLLELRPLSVEEN